MRIRSSDFDTGTPRGEITGNKLLSVKFAIHKDFFSPGHLELMTSSTGTRPHFTQVAASVRNTILPQGSWVLIQ
jgi:hypothetical protein